MRLDDLHYKELRILLTFTLIFSILNFCFLFALIGEVHNHVNSEPKQIVEQIEEVTNEEKVAIVKEEMKTIDISSRELHTAAPRPVVNQEDKELLARVIYQEAGGNECCDDCRRRVADVVLNRVNDPRFPNDIRSVLTAPRQYGLFYQTGVVWADRASNPGEKAAVDRAYRIAEEVLLGQHSELYGNGYIWQAEFKQGTEQLYHCNIYFGR